MPKGETSRPTNRKIKKLIAADASGKRNVPGALKGKKIASVVRTVRKMKAATDKAKAAEIRNRKNAK